MCLLKGKETPIAGSQSSSILQLATDERVSALTDDNLGRELINGIPKAVQV
jgi:hypothetical protein